MEVSEAVKAFVREHVQKQKARKELPKLFVELMTIIKLASYKTPKDSNVNNEIKQDTLMELLATVFPEKEDVYTSFEDQYEGDYRLIKVENCICGLAADT